MDKATNYLLIQEASLSKLINSMKVILPNVKSSLLKGNVNNMKKIAKKLPQKNAKSIERDAIRQIPGFKKDFLEAQKKIPRLKIFDNYTAKPAAIATALVSSTTKNSVDDVLKKGSMGVRNAKILPIPGISGIFGLIQLGLFSAFVAALFMTDGAVLIPTLQLALKALGMLFALIGSILKGAASVMSSPSDGTGQGIEGALDILP